MAINKDYIPVIVVGVAAAALLVYSAQFMIDVKTYPDVEIVAGGGFNHPVVAPSEYSVPANSQGKVVNLPHRYPTISGGNITALVHHGWSPLRMSKGMDQKWITCPPAEQMW